MWVPDEEEAFVVGEIVERRGEDVEVVLENGTVACDFIIIIIRTHTFPHTHTLTD